jgi:hypothetical protein
MSRKLALILGISLVTRLCFAPYTIFEGDERGTYELGRVFYEIGRPVLHGATMSTGTILPGFLQSVLTGLPLYLSHGHPVGAAVGLVIWSFLGLWLLFQMLRALFPDFSPEFLGAFVFLSPWTLMMASVMNPHYLIPGAALFYFSVFGLIHRPKDEALHFGLAFSIPLMLQFHLSAVAPLIQWGVFVLVGILPRPRVRGTLAGLIVSSASMWPYFIEKGFLKSATDSGSSPIGNSTHFSPERLLEIPKTFLRFLTFATGDTTRFIVGGRGYFKIFAVLSHHPLLILLYLVAMWGAGMILFYGGSFFLKKVALLRRFFLRNGAGFSSQEKQDLVLVIGFFITAVLFCFSSRGPSAQTIWCLLPLAFYAPLRGFQESSRLLKIPEKFSPWVALTILCGWFFAFFAYVSAVDVHRLKDFH